MKEWGQNSKEATKAWWGRLRGRTFKENMKAFGRVCYNNKDGYGFYQHLYYYVFLHSILL